MNKQKGVLGRGLASILGGINNKDSRLKEVVSTSNISGKTKEVLISQIVPNPFQPRNKFEQEKLNELAVSIEQIGIIQPITIRKMNEDKFQLISGERRFRAAQIIGLEKIPAYIRIANDKKMLEMALVENIQRQDLDPIEIAMSYQRLMDEVKLTQDQMSQRVGKKRSTIANYLRLLKLDPIIQTGMRDGFIGMGHGRAMVNIRKLQDQLAIYERVISKKLSVRATEALVNEYSNPESKPRKNTVELPDFAKKGLNRIFLHSYKINIKETVDIRIQCDIPKELDDFLDAHI